MTMTVTLIVISSLITISLLIVSTTMIATAPVVDLAALRLVDGHPAVGRLPTPRVPLVAHQPGGAEEPVYLLAVPGAPKPEDVDQRHVGRAVVVVVAGRVATPQRGEVIVPLAGVE